MHYSNNRAFIRTIYKSNSYMTAQTLNSLQNKGSEKRFSAMSKQHFTMFPKKHLASRQLCEAIGSLDVKCYS